MYCVIEFFESNASLIELSMLTVIFTGLINYSLKHFLNFIICFTSMSFFSSLYNLSSWCSGTLRPMCCVSLKHCLNVYFAKLFFERPSRMHKCGNFVNILFGCLLFLSS